MEVEHGGVPAVGRRGGEPLVEVDAGDLAAVEVRLLEDRRPSLSSAARGPGGRTGARSAAGSGRGRPSRSARSCPAGFSPLCASSCSRPSRSGSCRCSCAAPTPSASRRGCALKALSTAAEYCAMFGRSWMSAPSTVQPAAVRLRDLVVGHDRVGVARRRLREVVDLVPRLVDAHERVALAEGAERSSVRRGADRSAALRAPDVRASHARRRVERDDDLHAGGLRGVHPRVDRVALLEDRVDRA